MQFAEAFPSSQSRKARDSPPDVIRLVVKRFEEALHDRTSHVLQNVLECDGNVTKIIVKCAKRLQTEMQPHIIALLY